MDTLETVRNNIERILVENDLDIRSLTRNLYRLYCKGMGLHICEGVIKQYTWSGTLNKIFNTPENPDMKEFKKAKDLIIKYSGAVGIPITELNRDKTREGLKELGFTYPSKVIESYGGFVKFRRLINNSNLNKAKEIPAEITEDELLSRIVAFIKDNGKIPRYADVDVDIKIFRRLFADDFELLRAVSKKYPEIYKNLLNELTLNTPQYLQITDKAVKKYKKFIITSAVSYKDVDENMLNSISTYCEVNNCACLVLPCEDVFNRRAKVKWQLDTKLNRENFYVIFKDTYLNKNVYISDIKVSAKQINPHTGLPQFTQKGTCILASPKQDLEYVANQMNKQSHAIMTTGAITQNNYNTDLFMSRRTSKIAEVDHINGAVIVEIASDEIFHFRQVQAGANGEIIDLGVQYNPDGTTEEVSGTYAVLGDSHFCEHNVDVMKRELEILKKLNIKDIAMHDVFNGHSVSHHDIKKTVTQAMKYRDGGSSLQDEANEVADCLCKFTKIVNSIDIIKSNHHEFLERYLEEGRYVHDFVNLRLSLELAIDLFDGKDPFVELMLNHTKLGKEKTKLNFLGRLDSKEVYGVEISYHGHCGAGGARGSINSFRKAFAKSISAHTHTPKIFKGAWIVGTGQELDVPYLRGLCSWTHSLALIYPNGTRQMINIIKDSKDKYTWKK